MTKTERVLKLDKLLSSQFAGDYPHLIEAIETVDERIADYLLFWEDREQRAMICARTGKITMYRRREGSDIREYAGDDLQHFGDEVDARIVEIGRG